MSEEIRLDDLTLKQRECLEQVLLHRTSKQIAIALGISPYTVDQRLDSARRKLGVATRADAAQAYARLKAGAEQEQTIPERLVYQPQPMATSLDAMAQEAQINASEQDGRSPTVTVQPAASRDLPPLPDEVYLGDRVGNPQTVVGRLMEILRLSVLIMLAGLIGIAVAKGVSGLLRH